MSKTKKGGDLENFVLNYEPLEREKLANVRTVIAREAHKASRMAARVYRPSVSNFNNLRTAATREVIRLVRLFTMRGKK